MSLFNFRNNDIDYQNNYRNKLEDTAWENIEMALELDRGHSLLHFTEESGDSALIKRIIDGQLMEIDEDKDHKEVSSFTSQDEAYEFMANAILVQSKEICDWMFSDKMEFKDKREYYQTSFDVFMDEETGVTINKNLEKRNTNAIRLVLTRDYSATFGFYLKTAYPIIDKEHPEPIIEKYDRHDIVSGNFYDFHSDMQMTAFLVNTDKSVFVDLKLDDKHEEYIRLKSFSGSKRFVAYIDSENVSIKMKDGNEKRILTPLELESECPKMAKILKDAIYYLSSNIEKNQNMDEDIDINDTDNHDPGEE